jgi:hypothetical protein
MISSVLVPSSLFALLVTCCSVFPRSLPFVKSVVMGWLALTCKKHGKVQRDRVLVPSCIAKFVESVV